MASVILCCECGEFKQSSSFSKTQRKKQTSVCLQCVSQWSEPKANQERDELDKNPGDQSDPRPAPCQPENGICLTMHQPWASLVVYGIKRMEGRSWTCSHRGALWIHAAAKPADPEVVAQVEAEYRELYQLDGVDEIQFPATYPTSCLLGCVDVAAVVSQEELQQLSLTESQRLESESEFVFMCQNPKKLILPRNMSGEHKLWRLKKAEVKSSIKALRPSTEAPVPARFSELFE